MKEKKMMEKKITLPIDEETLKEIANIIDIAERCKKAYFWTNNGRLYNRLWREQHYNCDKVTWTERGNEYSAEYHFRQSRVRTYAYGFYFRNGEKTTLTAIRNSYLRLAEAAKAANDNKASTV